MKAFRLLLTAVAFAVSCLGAAAQDSGSAAQRFMWDQANARLASAQSRSDFVEAATLYQALIRAGVRNGPVFYNEGLALLKAERYPEALRALESAECYAGSDPEIRQNLQIALTKSNPDQGATGLPWYHQFVFWHYGIDLSTRCLVAAAGFSLIVLSLAIRLWNWRSVAAQLHILGVILLILFGSSVAASLHAEVRDRARDLAVDQALAGAQTTKAEHAPTKP